MSRAAGAPVGLMAAALMLLITVVGGGCASPQSEEASPALNPDEQKLQEALERQYLNIGLEGISADGSTIVLYITTSANSADRQVGEVANWVHGALPVVRQSGVRYESVVVSASCPAGRDTEGALVPFLTLHYARPTVERVDWASLPGRGTDFDAYVSVFPKADRIVKEPGWVSEGFNTKQATSLLRGTSAGR